MKNPLRVYTPKGDFSSYGKATNPFFSRYRANQRFQPSHIGENPDHGPDRQTTLARVSAKQKNGPDDGHCAEQEGQNWSVPHNFPPSAWTNYALNWP